MKHKYVKCDGFHPILIKYLDSVENYLNEMLELIPKMTPLLDKKPSELNEEEKAILKRSSELVLLTTITKELKFK